MNILLIIVLAFLLFMVWLGLHRGFIKTVWPFISLVVSLALIFIFIPTVKNAVIANTTLDETLEERIYENLMEDAEPDQPISTQIEDWALPDSLKAKLADAVDETVSDVLSVQMHMLSRYFAETAISAICYIVGFIVLYILLRLLGAALKIAAKLPLMKQADKILGLVIGLLSAFLILGIFFLVVTGFSGTEWGMKLMGMIAESEVLSFLYQHNLLVRLFIRA